MATPSPVDLTNYTLAWPRAVFIAVARGLLGDPDMLGTSSGPHDVVEVLLREAFVDGDLMARAFENETWRDELPANWVGNPAPFDGSAMVRTLAAHAEALPAAGDRTYFSERRGASIPKLDLAAVRSQFVQLVEDLYKRGYFDKDMPKGCVDDAGSGVDPNHVLSQLLGRVDLWPLTSRDAAVSSGRSRWGDDTLFDLIEVFHDLVARPRSRGLWHNWNNCGWHYSHHDRRSGQLIFRWRVNDLLGRSELPYRLADAGAELGRLVAVTNDERDDLADAMVARDDPGTGDRVRHAVALFRARAATEHDKQSAVNALYGVLEARRQLLKAELLSKDEDALFMIANTFAIRHHSESQKSDYDPVFLDWVFWWYLATIELLDRLVARQASKQSA